MLQIKLIFILIISILLIIYFIYNTHLTNKSIIKLEFLHEKYVNSYQTIDNYLSDKTNLLKCTTKCGALKISENLIIKNKSRPNADGRLQLNKGDNFKIKIPSNVDTSKLLLRMKIIFVELNDTVKINKFIKSPSINNMRRTDKDESNGIYEIYIPFQKTENIIHIKNNDVADSIQIMKLELYKTYINSPFLIYDPKIINIDKTSTDELTVDISNNTLLYNFTYTSINSNLISFDSSNNMKNLLSVSNDNLFFNNIKINKLTNKKDYLVIFNKNKLILHDNDGESQNIDTSGNLITNIIFNNKDNIKNILIYKKKNYTDILNNINNSDNINSLLSLQKIIVKDSSNNIKNKCYTNCKNTCSDLIDNIDENSLQKYNNCTNNCKNVISECVQMCNKNKYKSDPLCLLGEECPIVFKKNNKYFVKNIETGEERNYGKLQDVAKKIFKLNYPTCPIPSVLEPISNLDKCPFIINKDNPCHTNECKNINWDGFDGSKDHDQKCKNNIYNYCLVNSDVDSNCVCWSDDMKNNKNCIKLRRQYVNSDDLKCNASEFNIQSHPDFYKYIKKDNIPCWNCNIPANKPDKD